MSTWDALAWAGLALWAACVLILLIAFYEPLSESDEP